ncbi:ABSCISIC ACID-INSENSITIVE 5-like protein 3 [Aristolochia californica]|uniref:ABSCISIC ACID-INSENSITIVE 5-like protein 3 n=1 Tax=Aristolochia californica TaxID=171875 RepID=UPI0035E195E2
MFPPFQEEDPKPFPFRTPSYNFNIQSVQSLQVQSQMVIPNPVKSGSSTIEQWADSCNVNGEINGMTDTGAGNGTGEFIMENVSVATAQYQFQSGVGNLIETSRMVNISGNLGIRAVPQYPLPGTEGSGGASSSSYRQKQRFGEVVSTHSAKKYKRMIKNRESAARSRARKQAYTNQLEIEVKELRQENEKLKKGRETFHEEANLNFQRGKDSGARPALELQPHFTAERE